VLRELHRREPVAGDVQHVEVLELDQARREHALELVAREIHDGIWSIYFCRVLIGRLDERDYIIRG
jgi:hypothetical protein